MVALRLLGGVGLASSGQKTRAFDRTKHRKKNKKNSDGQLPIGRYNLQTEVNRSVLLRWRGERLASALESRSW